MYTGDRTPKNYYEDNFTHLQFDIIYKDLWSFPSLFG